MELRLVLVLWEESGSGSFFGGWVPDIKARWLVMANRSAPRAMATWLFDGREDRPVWIALIGFATAARTPAAAGFLSSVLDFNLLPAVPKIAKRPFKRVSADRKVV